MSHVTVVCTEPMVRRLPVLQTSTSEDDLAAQRPPWQWVLIGAGMCFVSWLPLLVIADWARGRLSPPNWAGAVLYLLSLFVASALGGALVGRFGGRARTPQAATAGGLLGLGIWLLALALAPAGARDAIFAGLVLLPVTVLGAGIGGWFGVRRRPSL